MYFLLVVLFVLSFLFELTYTTWSWAVAHNRFWLAVITTALIPWVSFVELISLIEYTTLNDRLTIGAVTSAGFACGTAAVLWWKK